MNKLKELEKKLKKVKQSNKVQNNQHHNKPAVNYSIAINILINFFLKGSISPINAFINFLVSMSSISHVFVGMH